MKLTKSGVVGRHKPLEGSMGHAGEPAEAGIESEGVVQERSVKTDIFADFNHRKTSLRLLAYLTLHTSFNTSPPPY